MASIGKNFTMQGGVKGMVDPFNFWHGKKGGGNDGGFEFEKYGGLRPSRIDYTDAGGQNVEILRPTQKALFDTVMRRSQGQDVGYDPEWMRLNTDLIKSNIDKSREDSVRDATGRLASSGLSGNPRAAEALTGRINRDATRTTGDSLAALSIADLERKNQERDVNTGRLQSMNSFNFGQEDKAADFDLSVYNAEQNGKLNAAGFNRQGEQFNQSQDDEFINSLINGGATAAGMYFGGPAGAAVGGASAQALTSSQGYGAAPGAGSYGGSVTPDYYKAGIGPGKSYQKLGAR